MTNSEKGMHWVYVKFSRASLAQPNHNAPEDVQWKQSALYAIPGQPFLGLGQLDSLLPGQGVRKQSNAINEFTHEAKFVFGYNPR